MLNNQNRNSHHSRLKYNNNNNTNSNWNSSASNRSDTQSPRPFLGKFQYCNVQGHSARRCPQLQHLQVSIPAMTSPFTAWQPRTNLALNTTYTANNWIFDSGATHHITSYLNNLAMHQPYNGGDDVIIDEGSGLNITHTGFSLLPSQSCDLKLHKVLCVPNIHKNLISMYRLCNTNQVSVEFFPTSFQVKDLNMGSPVTPRQN